MGGYGPWQFVVGPPFAAATEEVRDASGDQPTAKGAEQDFEPDIVALGWRRFGRLRQCCRHAAGGGLRGLQFLLQRQRLRGQRQRLVECFDLRVERLDRRLHLAHAFVEFGAASLGRRGAIAGLNVRRRHTDQDAVGLGRFDLGRRFGDLGLDFGWLRGSGWLAARFRLLLRQCIALGGGPLREFGNDDGRAIGERRALAQLRIGAFERGQHAPLLHQIVGDQFFGDAFQGVALAGAPFADRRATAARTVGSGIIGAAGCRSGTGEDQRLVWHQHEVALQVDAATGT